MPAPKIGQAVTATAATAAVESDVPVMPPVVEPEPEPVPAPEPSPTTAHETVMGFEITEYDIEGPTAHERVPDPPKIIQRKLKGRDLVWRWMSTPQTRRHGMRQYTAYSLDQEDRIAIQKGDCPGGVHINVDNRLCWGEDAFLATVPRRFYEARQRELAKINERAIQASRNREALTEAALRMGFKRPFVKVEEDSFTFPAVQ